MTTKSVTILREAAKAAAKAPSWDKATKHRLSEAFEGRYGWTATWDARAELGRFYGSMDDPHDREEHILMLLLAAEIVADELREE